MKHICYRARYAAYPLALLMFTAANCASADPTNSPAPLIASPQVQTGKVVVPDGTPVKLILDQDLKSGTARVGDPIAYHLEFDLYSQDRQLVAPAGTKAYGRVLKSSGHGIFGKPGKLDISADYIMAPDRTHISLRGGQTGGHGKNEVVGMVALSVLVSPLGVLINGRDINLHQGTQVPMYVDSDTLVTPYTAVLSELGINQPSNSNPITRAIVMNDGTTYTGVVTRQDDQFIYLSVANGTRTIKKSDVASVTPSL